MRNRRSFLHDSLETQLEAHIGAKKGFKLGKTGKPSSKFAGHDGELETRIRNIPKEEPTEEMVTPTPILLTPGASTMIDEDFGSTVMLTQNSQLLLNKDAKDQKIRELSRKPWSMAVWTKRMDEKEIVVKLPWLSNDGELAGAMANQKWLVWEHWAFVYGRLNAGTLEVYRNGSPFPFTHAQPGAKQMPDKMSTVIEVSGNGGLALAHFQLYDSALDPYEVADELELDRSATSAFLDISPLQFNLVDSVSYRNVLNIAVAPTNQAFEWEAQNRTQQTLNLRPAPKDAEPNEENYTFALEFRPNTFRWKGDLPDLEPIGFPGSPADWRWKVATRTKQDSQLQVVYWLYVGKEGGIGPEEALRFKVNYASAEGPVRSTRVLLQYAQLEHGISPPRLLQGSCLRQLTLTDYLERRSPLQATILLSDKVLNDGDTESKLLIAVENVADHAIGLQPESFIKLDFIDGNRTNALASPDQLKQLQLKAALEDKENSYRDISIQTDKGVSFTLNLLDSNLFPKKEIPARSIFLLRLSNIKTQKPNGKTPIFISFGNLEGILGNEQVLWVEKTPIWEKGGDSAAQVGIGRVANADETLAIKGKLAANTVQTEELIIANALKAPSSLATFQGLEVKSGIIASQLSIRGTSDVTSLTGDTLNARVANVNTLNANYVNATQPLRIPELNAGNIRIFNGKPETAFLRFDNKWNARISATNGMSFWGDGKESVNDEPAMTIHSDGLISMGKNHADKRGLLTLDGFRFTELYNHFHFARKDNSSFLNNTGQKETVMVGLYSTTRIVGSEFNIPSDARTKVVIGKSSPEEDLATLMQIQITDYRMKDIRKGEATQKKVIAQQVQQVYPQAISSLTEFVPDIYLMAKMHDGFIWLDIPIAIGDKLKLLYPEGEKNVEVISEVAGKGFTVDWPYSGEIMVYGREVDDFQMVDYDAISMLNVSATQALLGRIQQLETENAYLKTQQTAFASRLEALEAQMALLGSPNPIEA